MMEIHDAVHLQIYEHAELEYPNECCGVLLGNKDEPAVYEIVPMGNSDEIKRRNIHFAIDPLDIYKVERKAQDSGLDIMGFYHSHADYPAIPSGEDERYMIPGCIYVIVSVEHGQCVDLRQYGREYL